MQRVPVLPNAGQPPFPHKSTELALWSDPRVPSSDDESDWNRGPALFVKGVHKVLANAVTVKKEGGSLSPGANGGRSDHLFRECH